MARRDQGNTAVAEPDEVDTATASDEAALADSEVEDIAGTPVEAEAETVDLTGFWSAIDALDKETPDYSTVKAEYDVLSRKGKMQASTGIRTKLMAEVENDNYEAARSLSKVKKYFASLTPSTSTETADPTVELVNRIAALRIVSAQLSEGQDALEERIVAAVTSPDEKVQAAVTKLLEIRAARKPREPGSVRHNVGNHIVQVFANVASGEFLDYKAIGEATSDEYDGKTSTPSAVKAKLESGKFAEDGLSVETVGGKVGIRKA